MKKGLLNSGFGILIMVALFLAGFISTASAEAVNDTAQLQHEVRLLQELNKLNLTNEQIDKILPILKKVQTLYENTRVESEKMLAEQKSLLLQKKDEEAKAVAEKMHVMREKAMLEIKSTLLDLETIFTAEQQKLISRFMIGDRMKQGMMMQGKQGMMMQGKQGMMMQGKQGMMMPGMPMQGKQGMMMQGKKANPQEKVMIARVDVEKLDPQMAAVMLEKQLAVREKLADQVAKAEGKEKEAFQKQLVELDTHIAKLREVAKDTVVDGKDKKVVVMAPRTEMMRGQMMTCPMMDGKAGMMPQMRAKFQGKEQAGLGFFNNAKALPTLIKVLEEMRAASK